MGGDVQAPPSPAEPAVGRRILTGHVEEKRRAVALLSHRFLALSRLFRGFSAVLAPLGEGQRPETLLRDFSSAIRTISVGAFVQTAERIIDLRERFRLHLNQ